MGEITLKNFLGIKHLSNTQIRGILSGAMRLKLVNTICPQPLFGQCWALLFSKPSTRTRISFEVAIQQLGGTCVYLSAQDTQWGRGELIKDTARVLGRMIQGCVLRTHSQRDIEDFAKYSGIPTINALSDSEHPCQILADLLTIAELKGSIAPCKVAFVGDGNCNTARSLIWAAGKMNFHLSIASPKNYQPEGSWRAWENMRITEDLAEAVKGVDVLYTDTFVSMGRESELAQRQADLGPYWINRNVVAMAAPDAIVMHPLPAHRGHEIEAEVFEAHANTIFLQAENRLHVQKSILAILHRENSSNPVSG